MADSRKRGRELEEALDNYLTTGKASATPKPAPAVEVRPAGSKEDLASAYDAIVATFPGAKAGTSTRPAEPSEPGVAVPDAKRALLTAYHSVLNRESNPALSEASGATPTEPTWKTLVQPAIIATAIAGMAYLWVGKPAWLYPTFEPVPAPTTEQQATQLLIATSLMVEEFKEISGRLPASLDELGVAIPALSLTDPGNGGWQLATGIGQRRYLLSGSPGQSPRIEKRAP